MIYLTENVIDHSSLFDDLELFGNKKFSGSYLTVFSYKIPVENPNEDLFR